MTVEEMTITTTRLDDDADGVPANIASRSSEVSKQSLPFVNEYPQDK
jgi:hypothetical protein